VILFIAESEGLGHRQRFGNTGGLDQQIVEAALAGELADFFEQVFAQGAADAAIAHLHQLLFGAIEVEPRCTSLPSMLISLMSLMITATRRPSRFFRISQARKRVHRAFPGKAALIFRKK
jgi:hypothetical protein